MKEKQLSIKFQMWGRHMKTGNPLEPTTHVR